MTRSAHTFLLLIVSTAAVAAQQAACERPACLRGARWDGQRCRFERARPGSAGYSPTCGNSATLDSTRGVCIAAQCANPVKAAPVSGGTPGTVRPQAAPNSGGTPGTVRPQPAPISGGTPGTVVVPRAAPVSGGAPGVVVPKAAPISGGPPPGVQEPPSEAPLPSVNLQVEIQDRVQAECDGGVHASPVFRLTIANTSAIGTGGPVTIRAIDSRRPDVRGDTIIAQLGPHTSVWLPGWKVSVPRDLRYERSDFIRDYDVTVDPDHRFSDPDRSNNSRRVRQILIFCR